MAVIQCSGGVAAIKMSSTYCATVVSGGSLQPASSFSTWLNRPCERESPGGNLVYLKACHVNEKMSLQLGWRGRQKKALARSMPFSAAGVCGYCGYNISKLGDWGGRSTKIHQPQRTTVDCRVASIEAAKSWSVVTCHAFCHLMFQNAVICCVNG